MIRILVALTATMLLAACGDGEAPPRGDGEEPRAQSAALATHVVQAQSVVRELVLDGVLEAVHQSTVAAQTSARVLELPYDVGDVVEKGAVIVRFRDTEQAARLASSDANVRDAKARLDEAQVEHGRVRDIFERGLVARAQLDRAEAARNSAQARYEAAQAAARESREGAEHTVVRAPYAGIVVKRHIEVGETATVGRPLVTGLSLEHLRVAVEVPQHAIGPLRADARARVILPDGRSIDASDVRMSPQADTATHTFHAHVTLLPERVALAGSAAGALPGMLVKVAFASGESAALLVPPAAVIRRSEVTGVYVVGPDGRVGLRYVRAGSALADGRVPVLAGLEAGERVALDPIAAGLELKKQADAS